MLMQSDKANKGPGDWLLLLSFSLLSSFCFSSRADARLTLDGASTLTVRDEAGKRNVSGSYQITNLGDEEARQVYPILQNGSSSWSGEPQTLLPNQSYVWKVELELNPEQNPALPGKGLIPLRATRLYQDRNGFKMSARDVFFVPSPDLTPQESAKLRIPSLASKFFLVSEGQDFSGTLELRNLSKQRLILFPSIWTSVELSPDELPEKIEVEPLGSVKLSVSGSNFTAPPTSRIAVTVLIEWNEDGLHHATSVHSPVDIFLGNHAKPLRWTAALIVACGAVVALALVRMRQKRLAPA